MGHIIWSFFSPSEENQVALVVKKPLANTGDKEMQVPSPGWEAPLEEGPAPRNLCTLVPSQG